MLFLASRVVLALAYVAIFIPRKPERAEVRPPSKKAMVVKKALAKAGLQIFSLLKVQGSLSVLKLLTDPRKRKMIAPNTTMNMPRYLYSVNRKDVAPANVRHS